MGLGSSSSPKSPTPLSPSPTVSSSHSSLLHVLHLLCHHLVVDSDSPSPPIVFLPRGASSSSSSSRSHPSIPFPHFARVLDQWASPRSSGLDNYSANRFIAGDVKDLSASGTFSTFTMSRPRLTKKAKSAATQATPRTRDYSLFPVTKTLHHLSEHRDGQPILHVARGAMLGQRANLPPRPGQVGFILGRETPPNRSPSPIFQGPPHEEDVPNPIDVDFALMSRNRRKKEKQWLAWTTQVIPSIIPTYLDVVAASKSFRESLSTDPAVESFLGSRGYQLAGQDPLHRRFSNALNFFNHLQHQTQHHIDSLRNAARSELRGIEDHDDMSTIVHPCPSSLNDDVDYASHPTETYPSTPSRKRTRSSSDDDDSLEETDENPFAEPPSRDRPNPILNVSPWLLLLAP
ncbi:hypothetical protein ONZ45_g9253 [Pleurotus djamor]|nr:hypothetical protein ONZ45_g9253 [Pleurotus djamor]